MPEITPISILKPKSIKREREKNGTFPIMLKIRFETTEKVKPIVKPFNSPFPSFTEKKAPKKIAKIFINWLTAFITPSLRKANFTTIEKSNIPTNSIEIDIITAFSVCIKKFLILLFSTKKAPLLSINRYAKGV